MPDVDKTKISMYELLICLTNASDLISAEVADHHQQVAYLAFRIGERLDLPPAHKKDLALAGLLHDIGAFSLNERLALIENESNDHAVRGARLLEGFEPLAGAAEIIRYHHVPWENGERRLPDGSRPPYLSAILHLADRIVVKIKNGENVIGQIEGIRQKILSRSGSDFIPETVDAFMEISENEYIWLDTVYKPLLYVLSDIVAFDTVELTLDELTDLTKIFAGIIDFRNPFTANHTSGVAATAEKLASLAGFSENECSMMFIAGNLHDLGKLAVSRNILDKPAALTEEERNVIRSHTFYTYRLLQPIKGFETINKWASFHHEKLNGNGYPFHLRGDSIPLGSRIMAVADVFTAITEDRPYRAGMGLGRAMDVLDGMVKEGGLCPYVVSILRDNLEEINRVRQEAQLKSQAAYGYVMGQAK